jgi:predicted SprT family Zn-dependent metalloprotease
MNLSAAHSIIWKAMFDHKLFDKGWSFEWDNAKTRFGCCYFGPKKITMSQAMTLLNSEEDVRDTILHEIAHAIAGPRTKHGILWRIEARRVGARPIPCCDSKVETPPAKYIGKCVGCGVEVKRYKLTRRVTEDCHHTACRRMGKESKIEWRKA